MTVDPVELLDDGWWFWDESGAYKHGPFDTETEARNDLAEYCRVMLGGGEPDELCE